MQGVWLLATLHVVQGFVPSLPPPNSPVIFVDFEQFGNTVTPCGGASTDMLTIRPLADPGLCLQASSDVPGTPDASDALNGIHLTLSDSCQDHNAFFRFEREMPDLVFGLPARYLTGGTRPDTVGVAINFCVGEVDGASVNPFDAVGLRSCEGDGTTELRWNTVAGPNGGLLLHSAHMFYENEINSCLLPESLADGAAVQYGPHGSCVSASEWQLVCLDSPPPVVPPPPPAPFMPPPPPVSPAPGLPESPSYPPAACSTLAELFATMTPIPCDFPGIPGVSIKNPNACKCDDPVDVAGTVLTQENCHLYFKPGRQIKGVSDLGASDWEDYMATADGVRECFWNTGSNKCDTRNKSTRIRCPPESPTGPPPLSPLPTSPSPHSPPAPYYPDEWAACEEVSDVVRSRIEIKRYDSDKQHCTNLDSSTNCIQMYQYVSATRVNRCELGDDSDAKFCVAVEVLCPPSSPPPLAPPPSPHSPLDDVYCDGATAQASSFQMTLAACEGLVQLYIPEKYSTMFRFSSQSATGMCVHRIGFWVKYQGVVAQDAVDSVTSFQRQCDADPVTRCLCVAIESPASPPASPPPGSPPTQPPPSSPHHPSPPTTSPLSPAGCPELELLGVGMQSVTSKWASRTQCDEVEADTCSGYFVWNDESRTVFTRCLVVEGSCSAGPSTTCSPHAPPQPHTLSYTLPSPPSPQTPSPQDPSLIPPVATIYCNDGEVPFEQCTCTQLGRPNLDTEQCNSAALLQEQVVTVLYNNYNSPPHCFVYIEDGVAFWRYNFAIGEQPIQDVGKQFVKPVCFNTLLAPPRSPPLLPMPPSTPPSSTAPVPPVPTTLESPAVPAAPPPAPKESFGATTLVAGSLFFVTSLGLILCVSGHDLTSTDTGPAPRTVRVAPQGRPEWQPAGLVGKKMSELQGLLV